MTKTNKTTKTKRTSKHILNQSEIRKHVETTNIELQYITETKYDARMFRVVNWEYAHSSVRKFLREWEGNKYIYIKNRLLLNNELMKDEFYKLKLHFSSFINKDGESINYIKEVLRFRKIAKPITRDVFVSDSVEDESD